MISSFLPNIQTVLMTWARPTTVYIVCKRQQDFKTVESYIERYVRAMLQPKSQGQEIKAEGQRAWAEKTLFAEPGLELKIDDVIIYGCKTGKRYRVINKVDWSDYGYIEYDLRSDYVK